MAGGVEGCCAGADVCFFKGLWRMAELPFARSEAMRYGGKRCCVHLSLRNLLV